MTETLFTLTEDEFDRQYPLVANHLNANSSWAYGEGPGCLFETYGPELQFVRAQEPSTVWTLVDGDDGDQWLVSGYHLVNRIGYLVSINPVPQGITVEVHLPMNHGDEENGDE